MTRWLGRPTVRYLGYGIFTLVLFQALVLVAGRGDDALALFVRPKPTDVFGTSEFSVVEFLQSILLLASILVTAWHAKSVPHSRPLTGVLALFLLLLLVREQDYYIDQWLPWGTWRLPAVIVLAALVIAIRRSLATFLDQLRAFAGSASFGVLFAGFLVLIGFSRVFGQTALWTALLADDYQRIAKLAAEEMTELLGYCFILAGCIEIRFAVGRDTPDPPAGN